MFAGMKKSVGFAVAAVALAAMPAQAQQRTVNFYNWSNYIAHQGGLRHL